MSTSFSTGEMEEYDQRIKEKKQNYIINKIFVIKKIMEKMDTKISAKKIGKIGDMDKIDIDIILKRKKKIILKMKKKR